MASSPVQIFSIDPACQSSVHTDLWLLALLEELLLSLLLVTSLTSKVLLAGNLLDLCRVNAGDVDLVRCSDNVAGVDAAEGNTVDLEWTGDEENTLGEVLQENDALAAEATSKEDEDSAWGEGWARGGGTDGLADL